MNMMTYPQVDSGAMLDMARDFERKAHDRTIVIGVLGLGYVGLPLAQAFCRQGFRVVGFDISKEKVDALESGRSYINHISNASVEVMRSTGRFSATTDLDRLSEPDAILICVPTPLDKYRDPDLAYVISSGEHIAKRLRKGQLVVLESTTYPGTSEEVLQPLLERISGLKAQEDFALAYSPEREDPGNPKFETSQIPKVVGANSESEARMAKAIYAAIVPQVVEMSDLRTAEAVKLTENIFRAVNIGLVNELKIVFDAMGIDVWEVIRGASSKPFGFMPFYPGPGLGGHCIPIDPFYLSWKAREFGLTNRFIELAGEINSGMPQYVVNRLATELSNRLRKSINGSRILLVGLAYKRNVDDIRESPSLNLVSILEKLGAEVDYHDPHVPVVPDDPHYMTCQGKRSIDWTPESLSKYDAALIATDHDNVDYHVLAQSVALVVDTRNACQFLDGEIRRKIVKA